MVDPRIVLTAEDKTRAAFESAKKGLGEVGALAGAAGLSLAALGSAATLGGLALMVKNIAQGIDAMNDLKDATGASIENISALESIARRTGGNFDTVSTTLIKFNQALGATAKPGSEAERVLKAIGLNAKELRDMDPAEALRVTAVALNQFADDGNKARAVQELFGKSLKEVAPLLKDVAEAGGLVATVTTKQAEEAEKFNKELYKMQATLTDVARDLSGPVIAGFNAFAEGLRNASKEGDSLLIRLAKLHPALNVLLNAMSLIGVRGETSTIADTRQKVEHLNIALQRTNLTLAQREGLLKQLETHQQRLAANDKAIAASAAALEEAYFGGKKQSVGYKPADPAAEAAQKKAIADANRELEAQAKLLAELSGVQGDYVEQLGRLQVMRTKLNISDERYVELVEELIKKQPGAKKFYDEREKAEKTALAAAQERQKLRLAESDQIDQYMRDESARLQTTARAAEEALQTARDELAQRGLLKSQIAEITLVRLRDQLVAHTAGSEAYESIMRQIQAQEQLIGVLRDGELRDANEKAAKEAATAWAQVGDAFVDNLMRGGKSVAQYLKDLFRTLVLRPILAPIGGAVAGMIGGLPMAASAGQAATSGSGLLGTIGNAFGLAGTMGTFGAGLSAGFGGLTGSIGGLFGMAGTGATLGGSISAGMTALGAGNIAGGLGTLAGALGPIALGIMAIASFVKSKGETRSGGKYIGADFLEGPSGGEINGEASRTAISATMQSINQTLAALGSSASLSTLHSGFESSKKGRGFAYAGGQLSTGAIFGQTHGAGWENRRGSMTPEQAAAAFGEELKQATLQALQAANVPGQLGDYLRQLGDIDALSGGALDAALARINKALTEKQTLEAQLLHATSTDLENLIRAREAERNALDESNRALYDSVRIATDKRTLEQRLFDLTATDLEKLARTRELERASIDASLHPMLDLIYAAEDLKNAAGDAASAVETLAVAATGLSDLSKNVLSADLASALSDLDKAREAEQRDQLQAAANARRAELGQIKETVTTLESSSSRFRAFAVDLRAFRDSLLLGDLSPLTPKQKYEEAARLFEAVYAAAQGGDADAMGKLQGASSDFLRASQVYNASSSAYIADFSRVQAALTLSASSADSLATSSAAQLTILRAQLSSLESIDSGIGSVSSGVMSVAQATAQLAAVVDQMLRAGINPTGEVIKQITGGVTGTTTQTGAGDVYASSRGASIINGTIYGVNGGSMTEAEFDKSLRDLVGAGRTFDAYYAIKAAGLTLAEAERITGVPPGAMEQWAKAVKLPIFHEGTDYVPSTGLALLEQGERVISRRDNSAGNQALIAELQQLRAEVASLRAEHRAGVASRNQATMVAADRMAEGVADSSRRQAWERLQAREAVPQ